MKTRQLIRLLTIWLTTAAILCAGQRSNAAPAATFKVTGAVAKPATWTAASLRAEFAGKVKLVSYSLKGARQTGHVIPLIALVDWSRPKFNPHIKNHRLQFVVEVAGQDGYTADFSLGELLPEIGNEKVWVALDQDGKPLGEDGPVEVVVSNDQKPGRWVHSVAAIEVIDTAQSIDASGH